ncbi:putative zinc-type alcohol dehydrogenase-like protein [Saccharothrix carnea]|uniref:alcohol dehydrogenase (NADP(+)) n=1 Tax=Saccharothrix carnea TaxID=1280637 RepID=A0A2P8I0L3_SACCR|nr:NAD(P)-dependent alcohol dehydrogenase [Saccharothrix carnea]PSL52009.1 putative zinc-type alcohol dehydrogenase-like protein [Saccharothrix carnea]
MISARAYTAISATDPLVPGVVERRAVGPKDVLVEIAWAGICHSDIHTVRGDWGPVTYPLTVGHEIAGTVVQVGAEVTGHAVGDRVGVGCMVDSCRECANCRSGREQYCLRGFTDTFNAIDRDGRVTQGGYSTHIVVDEHFVLRLPDAIPFQKAAPLLCAGITTYSPLRHWNAGPGKKVAVVGLGGLGHMAVKFAHAMGAEVTVLSQSPRKREDALRFGADHYHATGDPATFERLANTFDLIVNTVSAPLDFDAYLKLLALDGTIVNVGAPPEQVPVTLFTLFANRRSFAGSTIGGIAETREMLDFCAEHGITPEVEVIRAADVNKAWQRVLDADVRYRFVIDIATLAD